LRVVGLGLGEPSDDRGKVVLRSGVEERRNAEPVACMEQIGEQGESCGMHGANKHGK
jgi:hypothetical protein